MTFADLSTLKNILLNIKMKPKPRRAEFKTMSNLTELSKKYCSRIKNPLSVEQICQQIESSEYSAELMLQHLVLAAAELEKEVDEQCVLNGKGSEREANLLGKIQRIEKDNAILKKKHNILFQYMTNAIMDALEVGE